MTEKANMITNGRANKVLRRILNIFGAINLQKKEESKKVFLVENRIVANRLILAKAFISLFTLSSLKRDGNELHALITFIAVGFNRRDKEVSKQGFSQIPQVAQAKQTA
ncbi:MAG: hypothetical protein ACHQIM_11825 [Sphingobacteriales bacterium]